MRQYSQRKSARRATSARRVPLISVLTRKNLSRSRLCHPQDVFQFDEMIQLGSLICRQTGFLFTFNQLGNSPLRLGRRTVIDHRLWSSAPGNEVYDLQIDWARDIHLAAIITSARLRAGWSAIRPPMNNRTRRGQ